MEDTRADKGLAFMLQYENVAWYDAGAVKILDRRVYPGGVEFGTCRTHVEVMQAIRDMVTQSAGPYTAAGMGMALAAWECREKPEKEQLAFLQQAAACIADARPTTKKRMEQVCTGCLAAAEQARASTRQSAPTLSGQTIPAIPRSTRLQSIWFRCSRSTRRS